MYVSIFYDLIVPEDLGNDNKQLKVKNVNFTIFPRKKQAIGYSYNKYHFSNQFTYNNSIILIEEWYGVRLCIICKYRYGDVINNKIEKYRPLDTQIRGAINNMREHGYKDRSKYDNSIELSKTIPEYLLYVKNNNNKICKFNEPIYEITTNGIITKEYLIYDDMTFNFWDKVENRFAFLIGANISDIDKYKQLFSSDYYSFAKPKN